MNINSFKTLTKIEIDIYEKMNINLRKGKPLTEKEFKILIKSYKEISKRIKHRNENSI